MDPKNFRHRCTFHKMEHDIFKVDEFGRVISSACFGCIEEQVDKYSGLGYRFLEECGKNLPMNFEKLHLQLMKNSIATGKRQAECLIRMIATVAVLEGNSVPEVMNQIRKMRAIDALLEVA